MKTCLLNSPENFNDDLLTIWEIFRNEYPGCILIISPTADDLSEKTGSGLVQVRFNKELGRLIIEAPIA